MVGSLRLLRIQLLAYWRRSFSKRGAYDRLSFFLVLIILLVGYRLIILLGQTAKSLSESKTGNFDLLLGIIFFVWMLPAFESRKATEKIADFLYLPLTKNQLSMTVLGNTFLLPTSIIASIISISAVYPLAFAGNFISNLFQLLLYISFSVFFSALFVRLLRLKLFRIFSFLLIVAVIVLGKEIIGSLPSPSGIFFENRLILPVLAIFTFFSAFAAIRQTISVKADRPITPGWISKVNFPFKSGEMIKKDFFAFWKLFDPYISLLILIFYVVVLFSGEFSFFSFSIASAFSVMASGAIAFNVFGVENAASLQRLCLMPIPSKDLLISKNISFLLVILSQSLILFPVIFYKFGIVYLLAAIMKIVSISFLYMAWGNGLSVRFPFKMNFNEISFGGSFQDILAAVFVISLISIVPDFFLTPNIIALFSAYIVLMLLSAIVYRFSLHSAAAKLSNEWENLIFKLS